MHFWLCAFLGPSHVHTFVCADTCLDGFITFLPTACSGFLLQFSAEGSGHLRGSVSPVCRLPTRSPSKSSHVPPARPHHRQLQQEPNRWSLALHSPSRQLVCMETPSAGNASKSLECPSLRSEISGGDLRLSLHFCRQRQRQKTGRCRLGMPRGFAAGSQLC